jgi:hypothetical protein
MQDPMIYDARHKDLFAHQLVYNEDGSIEAYGTQLDGQRVWIWIHAEANMEIIDYREDPHELP